MPRNGRTLAAWVAVALLALGMFAGALLYAANGHFKADTALREARELKPIVREIDTKVARILGILEAEGDNE